MKAELKPLKGKYYGTLIKITYKGFEYEVKLWNSGSNEPSDRELEPYDVTIEQWRNNDAVYGDKLKDVIEICDSHFESRETHQLAKELVELINNSR